MNIQRQFKIWLALAFVAPSCLAFQPMKIQKSFSSLCMAETIDPSTRPEIDISGVLDQVEAALSFAKDNLEDSIEAEIAAVDVSAMNQPHAREHMSKLTGKDASEEYQIGDISKYLLSKAGKAVDEFEFETALETLKKEIAEKNAMLSNAGKIVTGNEDYEFGDLTKAQVKKFTGKDEYEFGDLTKTMTSKAGKVVTSNEDYEFGDLTKAQVKKITGKDEYEFGDLTKTMVKKFTGKDEYQFGDVSKKVFQAFKNKGMEKKKP